MTYSEGLRHGYADAERAIREILAEDIPDAEKLKRIGWRVAERSGVPSGSALCSTDSKERPPSRQGMKGARVELESTRNER